MVIEKITVSLSLYILLLFLNFKHPKLSFAPHIFWLALASLKLLISITVFGLLNKTIPADIEGYFSHGQLILEGNIPGKNFNTPYLIGFNYLIALILFINNSKIALILAFNLAEMLGVLLIIKSFNNPDRHKINLFQLFYFLNPLSFILLGLSGQDESLFILVFGILLWITIRQLEKFTVLLAILILIFTKILSIWLLFSTVVKKGYPRIIKFSVIVAITFLLMLIAGINPFKFEFSRTETTGDQILGMVTPGNIWFLLNYLLDGINKSQLPILFSLACLIALAIFLYLKKEVMLPKYYFIITSILFFIVFGLTYKMSFPQYYVILLPGFYFIFFETESKIFKRIHKIFLIWTSLVSFDSTLFYYLKANEPDLMTNPVYIAYQIIITILLCYLLYFFLSSFKINELLMSSNTTENV